MANRYVVTIRERGLLLLLKAPYRVPNHEVSYPPPKVEMIYTLAVLKRIRHDKGEPIGSVNPKSVLWEHFIYLFIY